MRSKPYLQLKFFFFADLKNPCHAKMKRDERHRLHEAIKTVQDERRMDLLVREVQLQLTFRSITQEAFKYHRDLLEYAISLTKNRDDAGDLVQDTYLRVQTMEHTYTEKGNLRGWLKTIMKNLCIANWRKLQQMPTDFHEEDDFVTSCEPNRAGREFFETDVKKAINLLPLNQRTIMELYVLEGYKYGDIAKELDMPLGTVKNQIFMARIELRKQLKDYQKI